MMLALSTISSRLKAHIEARNCFYYSDVMVTCDERDREHDTYKCFPKLIIEGHLEKYSFFWEWQRDLKGSSLLKAAKWQLIEVP